MYPEGEALAFIEVVVKTAAGRSSSCILHSLPAAADR
jgi:hypothetical protein